MGGIMKNRKTPVRMTEDMRHKVAGEYRRAKKLDKRAIRERYNLSTGAINNWVRQGYGQGEEGTVGKGNPENTHRILVRGVLESVAGGAITVKEAEEAIEKVRRL